MNPIGALLRRFVLVDNPSALVRQAPTTLLVAISTILVLAVDDLVFTNIPVSIAAVAGIVLATALAGVFSAVDRLSRLVILIPFIDLFAIGLFRMGTGNLASIFAALLLLPVIWIASQPGRRYILFAGIGTSLALYLPFLLGAVRPSTTTDWLRGIVTPIIFAVAAASINEMSRRSAARIDSIHELVEEREAMLKGAVDYAERLSENEDRLRAADRLTRSVLDAVTEQSVIGSDLTGLIEIGRAHV